MLEIREDNVNSFSNEISKGISMVDFSATWCSPCRMQLTILQDVEKELKEVKMIKIMIDDEQSIAKSFQVQSVPTIVLFKDGKMMKKLVGLQKKDILVSEVNNIV